MIASKADNSKVNMCDFCQKSFAWCDSELIEFGDGKGNDNVVVCSEYTARRFHNNYPITGAPEYGIFQRRWLR